MTRVTRPGLAESPYSYLVVAVLAPRSGSVYRLVSESSFVNVLSKTEVVAYVVLIAAKFVEHVAEVPEATPLGMTVSSRLNRESNLKSVVGRFAPAVGAGSIRRVRFSAPPGIQDPP